MTFQARDKFSLKSLESWYGQMVAIMIMFVLQLQQMFWKLDRIGAVQPVEPKPRHASGPVQLKTHIIDKIGQNWSRIGWTGENREV